MVRLLGKVAELRHVGIFPRFEVMREWHEQQALPIDSFVIADGLHMNDWGYACFAQLLGDDIIKSVGQIKLGVNVPGRRADLPADVIARCRGCANARHSGRAHLLACAMVARFARNDDDSRFASDSPSRLLQRRVQILDQIVGMFEPGGEADKTFADAEFGARLRRQPLMRRGRRMGDEALGVAEIVGDPRQLQRVEQRNAAALPPLTSKPISVEPARICFFTRAACG